MQSIAILPRHNRSAKSILQNLTCWNGCQIGSNRNLSRAQVATALRPFYFLVHPDLFSKFPAERSVNETSYKLLSSYLNVMIEEKKIPHPIEATFYLKPRTTAHAATQYSAYSGPMKKVQVRLKNIYRVRDVITLILKSVDLPTSYVDSIPDTESKSVTSKTSTVYSAADFTYEEDDTAVEMGSGMHSMDPNRPLVKWLRENADVARVRLSKSEPIRYEVEKLQDELCQRLQLDEISWDCGWNLLHRRGALDSFDTMARSHFDSISSILKGRTLVFGDNSGVSLTGKIILFSGEVRTNWLSTIKRVPDEDKHFESIPLIEKALSQQLRNVRISQRDDQAVTLVDEYRKRVIHLITNMSDYLTRHSLPASWPDSLSKFQLCVETEAAPLMLSPIGQFIVPASCPGFLLVRFISDNMSAAESLMSVSHERYLEEAALTSLCINELGLIQLDRDESLNCDAMIDCCRRLLASASDVRQFTHGSHLLVTRYYSVLSDGVVCIPHNFNL